MVAEPEGPPVQRPSRAPTPVQRPSSASPPLQRPKQAPQPTASAPQPAPPPAAPSPRPAPKPAPASPPPQPVSDADKAAELDEMGELREEDFEFDFDLEPVEESEAPEAGPAAVERLDPDDVARGGVTVAPAVGAALCGHGWCDSYRGGVGAQFELGYRVSRFMPLVSLDWGAGSDDVGRLEELLLLPPGAVDSARTSFFGVGAGMALFFSKKSRFDPHASVRLGFSRVRSLYSLGGQQFSETVRRGSVRLGGGVDIFVHRYVAVGPRFDVTVGFGGRVCVRQISAPNGREDCVDVNQLEEVARVYSNDLPVPVFVGLQIRGVIPGTGRQEA